MAGSIEYTRPGEPAEAALLAAVLRLKRGEPLAPVTVVVRSALVGRDLRRRLALRSPLAGVGFAPLARVAELLAAADEGGRRPLSQAVLGGVIRACLALRPGIFSEVAGHPATEEALVGAYRLIRRLGDEEVARLASMSRRAADVVSIVGKARRRLEGSFYDQEDLLVAASTAVSEGGADTADLGPVVVHLPDPLCCHQRRLLAALAEGGEVLVQLALTGDLPADRAPRLLARQLTDLGFRAGPEPEPASQAAFDRVVGNPDAEEEVRFCLRRIMAHIEGGHDLGRVVIALPSGEATGYSSLIEELFDGAGIDWTAQGRGSLGAEGAGGLVLRLLELLADPHRAFERSEVISLVSSPFLEEGGGLASIVRSSLPGGPIRSGALDRASRLAGVVGGEFEWGRRLDQHAERQRRRGRDEAALVATDLSRIVRHLADLGRRFDRAERWHEVAAVAKEVVGLVGPDSEGLERISDALSELSQLDGLEELIPSESEGRAAQLRAAFAQALSGRAPSRGRFGRGPLVGNLQELAGVRAELLIVLGANEGSLPGRRPEDPLVNQLEREATASLKEAERREEQDRRHLLWLLLGAEETIATYPRVGRGAARQAYPSCWLAGELFSGAHEQVASYAAAVEAVAAGRSVPADQSDLEVALALAASRLPGGVGSSALSRFGDFGRQLAAEAERRRKGLSRFAGLIGAGNVDHEVFAAVMSATRMESLARCPLQFMLERLARVEILEAPERLPVMEPKVRGTLIHEVLENFVAHTMAPGGEGHWDDPDFSLLRRLAAESFERAEARGLTGKDVYWQMVRRRILSDLEQFVSLEARRLRANRAVPVRTEMSFGDGDVPPLTVSLGAGRQVRFKGKVDRIDEEPGGRLRVIDYKSGRDSDYSGMKADPLDRGRHLQLPIYAKAATELVATGAGEVVAEYRFCSSEAGFRTLPVALTPELDRRLGAVLTVLADTVENGSFPPRPGSGAANGFEKPANCKSCDYESICRRDRSSRWQEAASTGQMAPYVELVEKGEN